jgi:UDP-N-acetylmuramyl tripeptide synthase
MGAVAAELADRVVVTSDNPRTEDPRAIIDAIVSGIPLEAHANVTIEPDRERAIRAAISRAGKADIVLIAGKGHEDYQILPDPDAPADGGHAKGTIKRHSTTGWSRGGPRPAHQGPPRPARRTQRQPPEP